MQVPETPKSIEELDLMRRLAAYAQGKANWNPERELGDDARASCEALHSNIVQCVNKVLARILDRVTAREMDTFTMHDHTHGLKVAHLMWHILAPLRRERLTPAEIALLIFAAHIHDAGMALSDQERAKRLAPESDLWERLEIQESTKAKIQLLQTRVGNGSGVERRRAKLELDQAEEALLCQDTRERHASRERYEELMETLRELHRQEPEQIPSIDGSLTFDGDSFRHKLIDTCVSHNEDAEALVRRDAESPERPRFPSAFPPLGCCTADLHMVAAALRLADILDFDRERTPPVLFYYLIPSTLSPAENRSVLEWGKHLAISNWHVDKDAIIFRGRCRDHIIHHAVVLFCGLVQDEIASTRATFGALGETVDWPFLLPASVKAEIYEEGYRYVPYRFELDDQRIYELLMGGAIYERPLVAVREMVQNAVDACKLRDALTQLDEPYVPLTTNRIIVSYEEPSNEHTQPLLIVSDTGTGMDAFILERYFLKVGQSYYRSVEFNHERVALRKKNLDFAPISEFGIGFLSSFLLADRVEVETAMWEPHRGDVRKRVLTIDGPTRLIRLSEEKNEGSKRFKGTHVKLYMCRGGESSSQKPPTWDEVRAYLEDVCQDLPYRLHLRYSGQGRTVESWIDPKPLTVKVSPHIESAAYRIPVSDEEFGLEGEIVMINLPRVEKAERKLSKVGPIRVSPKDEDAESRKKDYFRLGRGDLLRGGFKISGVPGLPELYSSHFDSSARLRLTWRSRETRRYAPPNLARSGLADVTSSHSTSPESGCAICWTIWTNCLKGCWLA
jgi:hypothetical protein